MATVNLERRAAVRENREAIRQLVNLKELQHHFVSYRSKVEVAVEALWDIARELHELQVAALKQARTGHLTSSLGSGLLGGALLGGLLTAGPLVTVGLFTGTVLTSLGSLITFTGKEGKRARQLELQVTSILSSLEREYEKCQQSLVDCGGEQLAGTGGLEQLRLEVEVAERQRPGGLDTVYNILNNIARVSNSINNTAESLPREVRNLLDGGLAQVQYFISPYGASALVNLLRGGGPPAPGGPVSSLAVSPGATARLDAVAGAAVGAPPTSNCQKKSLYSSLGKLGKVAYTVGAVLTAYEFYSSVSQARDITRKIQTLRDSSELLRYEGAAKEVFNIALDLQLILSTVFKEED